MEPVAQDQASEPSQAYDDYLDEPALTALDARPGVSGDLDLRADPVSPSQDYMQVRKPRSPWLRRLAAGVAVLLCPAR